MRGFKIKDVPGDNNCQFHALTDQLEQLGISGWSAVGLINRLPHQRGLISRHQRLVGHLDAEEDRAVAEGERRDSAQDSARDPPEIHPRFGVSSQLCV